MVCKLTSVEQLKFFNGEMSGRHQLGGPFHGQVWNHVSIKIKVGMTCKQMRTSTPRVHFDNNEPECREARLVGGRDQLGRRGCGSARAVVSASGQEGGSAHAAECPRTAPVFTRAWEGRPSPRKRHSRGNVWPRPRPSPGMTPLFQKMADDVQRTCRWGHGARSLSAGSGALGSEDWRQGSLPGAPPQAAVGLGS